MSTAAHLPLYCPLIELVLWRAMKILLIEHDAELAGPMSEKLRASGHRIERTASAADGLIAALSGRHDALIVDCTLPPALDGLELVRKIRAHARTVPILVLTTLRGVSSCSNLLAGGADDCLSEPFGLEEIEARVAALGRRSERQGSAVQTILRVGSLEVDLLTRTAKREGLPLHLAPMELRLLEYMMRQQGQFVTRMMLLEHALEMNFDPGTNIVEAHMSRLRRKLDSGFGTQRILTIRGEGYFLRPD